MYLLETIQVKGKHIIHNGFHCWQKILKTIRNIQCIKKYNYLSNVLLFFEKSKTQ